MSKKRYENANQIRDAIDTYKRKAQKLRDSAYMLDLKADEFAKAGNAEFAEDISFHREKAKKKRRAAGRIEERQLGKLKHKLSEFQTEVFKEVITDGDKSIPVR